MEKCREIAANREYTSTALKERGFAVLPSKTNFLFARSEKIGGEELYRPLKKKGVLVRHFNAPRIAEYNRITIGTKEQMDAFLRCVDEICKEQEI